MVLELSQMQAATDDWYKNRVTDNYFNDSVLFHILAGDGKKMAGGTVREGQTADGGQYIREHLKYAPSNVGTYDAGTVISANQNAIINAARFSWCSYYASEVYTFNDRLKNAGQAQQISIIREKLDNIMPTLQDHMGSKLYVLAAPGDDGKEMLSLLNLVSTDKSIKYGKIAENDMATWKANQVASGVMTFKFMQQLRRTPAIGQNNNKRPNLYITSDMLKDTFENDQNTQTRYNGPSLASGSLLKAGFDNIMFKNAPIVADDKIPGGSEAEVIYGLNTNHLFLRTHKDYSFSKPVWEKMSPRQPDVMIASSIWAGQLTTNYRAAHVYCPSCTAA